MRSSDNAIDRRTHNRPVEALFCPRHLSDPVVGLGLLDAGFRTVIAGQSVIHQRECRFSPCPSSRERGPAIPIFKFRQHRSFANRVSFFDRDELHYPFDVSPHPRRVSGGNGGWSVYAQRQGKEDEKQGSSTDGSNQRDAAMLIESKKFSLLLNQRLQYADEGYLFI